MESNLKKCLFIVIPNFYKKTSPMKRSTNPKKYLKIALPQIHWLLSLSLWRSIQHEISISKYLCATDLWTFSILIYLIRTRTFYNVIFETNGIIVVKIYSRQHVVQLRLQRARVVRCSLLQIQRLPTVEAGRSLSLRARARVRQATTSTIWKANRSAARLLAVHRTQLDPRPARNKIIIM